MLSLYRTLIGLRNSNAALHSGRIERVASNGQVLRYERVDEEQRFAVLLNLSESHEDAPIASGRILVSTYMDRTGEAVASSLSLRGFEGVLVKLN
jgi:alpha-glucosidase